jgi:RHS repeat-associated protein
MLGASVKIDEYSRAHLAIGGYVAVICLGLFLCTLALAQGRHGEFRALKVYVAFADNRTPSKNFPSPWQGSPNVKFFGRGPTFNSGAVLLSNPSPAPVTVDSVEVDLRRPGPRWSPSNAVTVPAYGAVILTQQLGSGSYPIRQCGQSFKQGETRIPWVAISIGGQTEYYSDYDHVLDAGGLPASCYRNYSLSWRPVASSNTVEELASVAASPARPVAPAFRTIAGVTSVSIASTIPNATQAADSIMTGTVSYAYDAVGNRTQVVSSLPAIPSSGLMQYDANDRLTTEPYDANGNIVSSAGIENKYDFEGRLVQQGDVQIVYDGDGNRVAETVGGVTTQYLIDDQNPTGYAQVMEELQGGYVNRRYTWGHWLLSQTQLTNGEWTTSYYGYDGHGSVRFLTDSTGAITDNYDYDAFGNLIRKFGTTPNTYLFAGEQYDKTLDLYYNRARYLDVRAGRFWGIDKYEGRDREPLSLHKYLYADANPINKADRNGNFSVGEVVQAVGIQTYLFAMAHPTLMSVLAYTTTAANVYFLATDEQYRAFVISSGPMATQEMLAADVRLITMTSASLFRNLKSAGLAAEGLEQLAALRRDLNLAPAGTAAGDKVTLSKLVVGDANWFGISAHGQEVTLVVNPISASHAEADVFQQAYNAKQLAPDAIKAEEGILYLDQNICQACGRNGAAKSMARQIGLKRLTVVMPEGTVDWNLLEH